MFISGLGALFFGLVIGWISYRALRLTAGRTSISDIAIIIGAVGGAAVTALFRNELLFGWYCIGLTLGFFAYPGYGVAVDGLKRGGLWRVSAPITPTAIDQAPATPVPVDQAPVTPVPVDQPPAVPAEDDNP